MSASISLPPRNYNTHDFYAVHLDPSVSPSELADHLGLTYDGPLGSLTDHHLFRASKESLDVVSDAIQDLKRRRRKRSISDEWHILDSVKFNQKQKLKPRMWKRDVISTIEQNMVRQEAAVDSAVAAQQEIAEKLSINDPIFNDQWHLYNAREKGNDLNVTGVWLDGITGKNVTVCIIDDGLDMDSDDLHDNYFKEGSYDFNDHVDEPKPMLDDDKHGTRCAGEIAAVRNNVCGVGVAYDSRVSGVRILSGEISDADEALAVNYKMQDNDIYSCSWGPPDDGQTMQAPGILIKRAMLNAVQEGRGGKGSIYVFAAGNGAASDDNCNFDGYTNSIYSVTVGAIDKKNLHPYYSEACSAQLVVTYSSGSGEAIHTTDVGKNTCAVGHGGTSAAGPLAAGIYALALSARPELTWRDIQWITVKSAVPFEQPSDWQTTVLGKKYSHQFGYGKLDAYGVVELAKTWELVKPQAWFYSPWLHVKHKIPQGDQGIASHFTVTKEHLKAANLHNVEHVTVTMNVEHTRRGDISVELRSPSGIISHLSTARRNDEVKSGYVDWTFMSVAHWGETGQGKWTIIVKDTVTNEHTGEFTDWKLRLWGECIDPSIQEMLPMPSEHDDDDHDVITSAHGHTTTISLPTNTQIASGNPSDHITRPINQKPTTTTSPSNSESALPTTPAESAEESPAESAEESPTPSSSPENFLPSPFPTFGVSKRTQIWIYGALAVIIIFCGSLAIYMIIARRKRLRNNPRDNYEFQMINDQEEGAQPMMGAGGRRNVNKTRAGALYDAFAGESDEELFSDDEDETYHDEKPREEDSDKKGSGSSTPSGGSSSASGSASSALK